MFKTFRFIAIIIFVGFFVNNISSQSTHGSIYADTNNLLVIKVQGTHYQRGFAQGEILASRISDIFLNYVKPQFGNTSTYNQVRGIIAAGNLFSTDSVFVIEAKAMIDGMNSINSNPHSLDYVDVLLANSILDIKSILSAKGGMECSSLMSWNSATAASGDLGGKSVISRHLDWTVSAVLTRNQVMVIHIPSESNEQAWASIGFAGMMSVVSGFNANMGVFQHMMGDDNSHGIITGNYEPIWFTLRKSIELIDPNQDGANNVNDVKYFINQRTQGFADGYIISALAKSTELHDSLIAMVAEIAPVSPIITYRSNSYADSIPDDNLYTANNQIARNNSLNFCSRYNGVRNNISNGLNMSVSNNRSLMQDYSHLTSNYQFMTFAPEIDLFRVSIRNTTAAYLSPEMDFSISNMFSSNVGIEAVELKEMTIKVYPNPINTILTIDTDWTNFDLEIIDSSGKIVMKKKMTSKTLNVENLSKGVYTLKINLDNEVRTVTIVK